MNWKNTGSGYGRLALAVLWGMRTVRDSTLRTMLR
jgi:hypothetical protein